ncbi:SDR family NAD(P)-dependent oxidoreductase [Clostridium sp. 'White wine YQ']|uniref:SDR family NAD(P)-dependent oxidoreductase n=1 Tax=Clostridium sp. 'White wine YQ' TaxID=3027474 RepID=UPI002365BAB6|nr:SDR family NAD(P)-dependent oxidoreductase [Clostridium sp. 'White wine YQ']MDD7794394.1 SDR family NAD(P)-dependent oxidoreductase [Clostridium sp. 'White wine YQ']
MNTYEITPQIPLKSGFGPQTTAREVLKGIDLRGKTVIVTGGYSGIGLETTRALAESGATVIVPARTLERARASVENIPRVQVEEMDLMNPASIDAFSQKFLSSGRALDILINNAGIMAAPLSRDARGFESQFATNHLGHFQLTARLWPALKQAGNARVVSLSSTGIRFGGVDFDDPNFQHREYNEWVAYGQSKSANALFAVELDRRGHKYGVRAFSVHPGRILGTNLIRYMTKEDPVKNAIQNLSSKDVEKQRGESGEQNIEQGAATSVWCATSPQLEGKGGVYCMNVDIANAIPASSVNGELMQVMTGVLPWAIDPKLAERLWKLSEDLTGVIFEVN